MNKLAHSQLAMHIAERGCITPEDVRALRRECFSDERINLAEAEALLALDVAVETKCKEWTHFFVEALVDFVVEQSQPAGIVSDEGAKWLADNISNNELVESPERLEMLVKVLETAKSSPEFLMTLALQQVSKAVRENQGHVAKDRAGETNVICKSDVELIRRLIFGPGGEGGLMITRAEAEFLFDLNDQTVENQNDPAWADLFVRAVGSYMMATSDRLATTGDALPDKGWLEGDTNKDRMVNSLRAVYRAAQSPTARANEAFGKLNSVIAKKGREAAVITQDETKWITDRIGADGALHTNEKALLNFLSKESHDLHPDFKKLIDDAA